MKYFFQSLICIIVIITQTHAQQPPVLDRELFFGDPEISGAQISPDGKFITFVKPFNNVRNIWVKTREQKFTEAKPLTADSLRPVTGYFWSRDSKYVLFVQDQGGNENYRVYAVDPAAAGSPVPPAKDLTPLDNVRAMIYDVPKKQPDIIFIGLNDRDPQLHDVYSVNLVTGERKLIRKNDENVVQWFFDLDGKLRLGARMTGDGGTEFLNIQDDKLVSFYSVTAEESASPVRFLPDGKRFYLETNKGGDVDKSQLMIYDLTTNAVTFVEKDPLDEVDFGTAVFSDITNELIATEYTGDRNRYYFRNKSFENDYHLLEKLLPKGEIAFGSWTADENVWLARASSDIDPGSVYLFDRIKGTAEFLYRSRPTLPTEQLSERKPVRYTGRDGVVIPAYLTLPKGTSGKNLPVILYVHGGPWARDFWGYDPMAQFLANRGYAVLQPNFRGSTGYGKRFLNLGNKEWGRGTMQHDLSDAVAWLIKQGIADPKKVAISGGSYGGYATLAGVAFTPDLYAAGFSIVGPSSIVTLLNSIPPYWAPLKKMFDVRVGNQNDPAQKEMLEAASPLNYAREIKTPLYIVQGANDPRVKKTESDQIVIALRELGRDVEYMVAPDEGHGFAGKENRLAMIVAMEQFFSKRLGGRVQKDVRGEIQKKLDAITVDINTVTMAQKESSGGKITAGRGAALALGTTKYKADIQSPGHAMKMDVKRVVEKTELDGKAVLLITEESTGMMGGTDLLYLNPANLLPVKRVIKQGGAVVNMMFTEKTVTGEIAMGPQKMPIDIKHDANVFTDESGLDILLSSLDLKAGFKATVSTVDVMQAKVKENSIAVEAEEHLSIGAGEFNAYKVAVKPAEGDDTILCWYDAATKQLLKKVVPIPTQMGGGNVVFELVK